MRASNCRCCYARPDWTEAGRDESTPNERFGHLTTDVVRTALSFKLN